jgi:hypothetical protein
MGAPWANWITWTGSSIFLDVIARGKNLPRSFSHRRRAETQRNCLSHKEGVFLAVLFIFDGCGAILRLAAHLCFRGAISAVRAAGSMRLAANHESRSATSYLTNLPILKNAGVGVRLPVVP